MSQAFKWKITGIKASVERLQRFKTRFRTKALRKAGNAASPIVLKALKANAPVKSGTWKKSLGRKVVVNKDRLWYGAGPRSSFYATVTFNPGKGRVRGQSFTTKKGQTKQGGGFGRKTGSLGGTVGTLKKSKKGPSGVPALFWRDRSGRVRAMPLVHKRRPVLYSHLIEKGSKTSKAHHVIQRTAQSVRGRADAAAQDALAEAIAQV